MENAVEFALQRSSAPSGLQRGCAFPTAYAVGFILAPLCGCINDGVLKLFAGLLCSYQGAIFLCRSNLRRGGFLCDHGVVQLHIVVSHAVSVEGFAGALERTVGEIATQLGVFVEDANRISQALGIVRGEI